MSSAVDIRLSDERLAELVEDYASEIHTGRMPEAECAACRHSTDTEAALRELQALRLSATASEKRVADALGLSHGSVAAHRVQDPMVRAGMKPKKVAVKWGKPIPLEKRFYRGQQLYINGKLVGAFYGHEEDRSLASVVEVLEHLAHAGAIEYAP